MKGLRRIRNAVESDLIGEDIGWLVAADLADDVVVVSVCPNSDSIRHGGTTVPTWSVWHLSISLNKPLPRHIPIIPQAIHVLFEVSSDTVCKDETLRVVLTGENQSARAAAKFLSDVLLDGAHVSRHLHDRKYSLTSDMLDDLLHEYCLWR